MTVQQAKWFSAQKIIKSNGIAEDSINLIGDEDIKGRKENKEDDNNFNKKILLNEAGEIKSDAFTFL